MGWLSARILFPSSNSFFRFPSDLEIVSLSFAIYRIFCLNSWEFKNGSRVVVFGSGDSLYFSCQFEYLDLVQNLLVHGCDFGLPIFADHYSTAKF